MKTLHVVLARVVEGTLTCIKLHVPYLRLGTLTGPLHVHVLWPGMHINNTKELRQPTKLYSCSSLEPQ